MVVFIGAVGLGKNHLAAALGGGAWQIRLHTHFTPAAAMLIDLIEVHARGLLAKALKRYLRTERPTTERL